MSANTAAAAASNSNTPTIAQKLWDARIPLHVTHPSSPWPLVTSVPRVGYLALLLPRLTAYFGLPCSSFRFDGVVLRNLPAGLLADLYRPTLPWRLVVEEGVSWDISDTFLNAAKEADFIRNGNANQIMKMSKEDTTQLWHAVIDNDRAAFDRVNRRLLDVSAALRHVPVRIYLPLVGAAEPTTTRSQAHEDGEKEDAEKETAAATGSFKIIQPLCSPGGRHGRPRTTLGQALREAMPGLFPSSRDPVLAAVVLHGARVPFGAPLEELMAEAAYPDGWLNLVVDVT